MLTESEIKRFIEEDAVSERKRLAAVGQRYYEATHDILNYRMFYYDSDGQLVEDRVRANYRICHPFFTELADQLAAYIMSFEESPIRAIPAAEGLQEHLDTYFDDEFWSEFHDVITGAYVKGGEYLYAFKNANDRLAFQWADSMNVVEVPAKYASDEQDHILYWYIDRIEKGRKIIKRIQDHTATEITYYKQVDNGRIKIDDAIVPNPAPNVLWKDKKTGAMYGNGLGFIPFWRLDNNRKQISGLKPIKGIIDDYDLIACGLSNNLKDFDTPLYAVSGFQGDDLDQLSQNIRTKKTVGIGEGGDIEIKTVEIPYEARKQKLEIDERNIYRFGMGLNTVGLKDTTATTNLAIKAAYSLLDLKANKLIKRIKQFLKGIIKAVLDEINKNNKTDYQNSDVEVHFEPEIPTNAQENAQIELTEAQAEQLRINSIIQVATVIGDEETLRAICDILDLDYEELKDQIPQNNEVANFLNAQSTLAAVVTDDEQPTEDSSTTVS